MNRTLPRLLLPLLTLVLLFLASPSGALSVDVHPNAVCPGDMVSIDITGLGDGSSFNHTLTSTNLVSTGLHWYNLTSFNYPFSITSGRVHVEGHNVDRIKIETKLDGVTTSIQGTGAGTVTLNFLKEINATVFDYYLINYDVTNTALPVTITWIHNGTKAGADDSTTTFHVDGASAGDIRCLISVDGTVVDDEVVTISACPTPAPPGPGRQTGRSSNDFPAIIPTATTTVPTIVIFYSPDEQVSVVTSDVPSLEILPDLIPGAPEGWKVVFGPYTISPAGTPLGPPGLLHVVIPDDVLNAHDPGSLGIARYVDGTWQIIPSRIDDNFMTARIDESGTFAVIAPEVAVTSSIQPGETWSWEFVPPIVVGWLGQETAGQYDERLFGPQGIISWTVLFGVIVTILIIALFVLFYMRRRRNHPSGS